MRTKIESVLLTGTSRPETGSGYHSVYALEELEVECDHRGDVYIYGRIPSGPGYRRFEIRIDAGDVAAVADVSGEKYRNHMEQQVRDMKKKNRDLEKENFELTQERRRLKTELRELKRQKTAAG